MARPRRRRNRRPGFTLIELLVVIVILGILIALLVPVISNAVRKAREGAVKAEIDRFSTGLEMFKDRYGDYPPSRIILSESGAYDTSSGAYSTPLSAVTSWYLGNNTVGAMPASKFGSPDISLGALSERSIRFLRKFWPRAAAPTMSAWHDFNGDGQLTPGLIYLEGHEALVFFLGGIPDVSGGGGFSPSGFPKDPVFPFRNRTATNSRNQPFFEFRSDRLIDEDNDGIPGYVDSLATGADARPYVYFSSYYNGGYDPNDANFAGANYPEVFDDGTLMAIPFAVTFAPFPVNSNRVTSPAPNPYTSSFSVPPTAGQSAVFYNPTGYQILSPGGDRLYGMGGQYLGDASDDKLPFTDPSQRIRERDNIGNFSAARLE